MRTHYALLLLLCCTMLCEFVLTDNAQCQPEHISFTIRSPSAPLSPTQIRAHDEREGERYRVDGLHGFRPMPEFGSAGAVLCGVSGC